MPSKYVIHTQSVPRRFQPVTESGIIAWEEGCLKCAVCVKTKCVYGVYDHRGLDARHMVESIDNECMNCLRCVQGCPKELIHKSINPEFMAMGDEHWSPNVIASLWSQSDSGKIPVSGAGYPGPFSGPGFDAIWTDMSEIVRPTRDGIHGREYISTAIDLGKTPDHLVFNRDGNLEGDDPLLVDIPLPIMFKMPMFGAISEKTLTGWAKAAKILGTFFSLPVEKLTAIPEEYNPWLLPSMASNRAVLEKLPERSRMVELSFDDDWRESVKHLSTSDPAPLITMKIPMAGGMEEKAQQLAEAGVSIIHLEANFRGRAFDGADFLKDGIRSVHLKLVEAGIRDNITLLASGGISMAEHVAKAIICGADGVFMDFPMLIALECRMCRRCEKGLSCPVDIQDASAKWTAGRVVNLVGAWHNQLLEVMGAMGIREVRRLRGEVGRAMFFEQLDRETFGAMGAVEEDFELE
ncbi:MAG: alpha-hydroxy-acid oxidizing protein [Deltaproteobacteria bacterium]|nr:alpha-hydroxy-acid oxidizing protein [Deltaproteobacteria bacterium]